MLAIRLQRTGRKGLAQYRIIVQDSHRSPKSGSIVARLGSHDPHTKTVQLDKEKAQFYLDNGAQPSDRVAALLKSEGVKLPKWVSISAPGKRSTRNPEKLRKNQPEQPKEEKPAEEPKEALAEQAAEAPAEEPKAQEAPAEEVKPEEKLEKAPEKAE